MGGPEAREALVNEAERPARSLAEFSLLELAMGDGGAGEVLGFSRPTPTLHPGTQFCFCSDSNVRIVF